MAEIARTTKIDEHTGADMHNATGLFDLIEQKRKVVLWTPFVLAVILGVAYSFGGSEFRQVLDFMSPGRILGR
jgi:hypothetical protein